MYMKGAFRLEGAFYFSYFAIRAFFSARTISGISKMCTMIPGTAFAKAPARNAAQVKGASLPPSRITMEQPQTMRPSSMAEIRET